jgi:hypothetical protein
LVLLPASQPTGPLPDPGRDQRGAQRCNDRGRHRLAPDSRAVRPSSHDGTTPVVALNRAVALAEVDGAAAALPLVDALELDGYHPFHATRADLLRRLGRSSEAAAAYERAAALAPTGAKRDFLRRGAAGSG